MIWGITSVEFIKEQMNPSHILLNITRIGSETVGDDRFSGKPGHGRLIPRKRAARMVTGALFQENGPPVRQKGSPQPK